MTRVRLECTTGGSNKFYEFETVNVGTRYTVNAYYGAIGQAPKLSKIYDGDNEQQALKELDKKITEKLRKGYVAAGQIQTTANPEPKTPGHPGDVAIVWPTAAQGVKEGQVIHFLNDPDFIAEEKIDGMRCTIHITNNGLRIFSRNAGVDNPHAPLEKTASLPHLAALKFPALIGTVLDAELKAPGHVTAAELSGMVHSAVGAGNAVKAYVFDIVILTGKSLRGETLDTRKAWLKKLATDYDLFDKFIALHPWETSVAGKKKLHVRIMNGDGEGLMFKFRGSKYVDGARPTATWYKLKKQLVIDAVVMGFVKGKGKYNNQVGAVEFGQYIDGTLTKIGQASGMTDDIRRDMTENSAGWIGMVIRVRGQERLKSGAIRHCVYAGLNPDKRAKDCVAYPDEQ